MSFLSRFLPKWPKKFPGFRGAHPLPAGPDGEISDDLSRVARTWTPTVKPAGACGNRRRHNGIKWRKNENRFR